MPQPLGSLELSLSPSSPPKSKQAWYVLHQDETGSYLANDPPQIGPKITLIIFPEPLAGVGMRLAGRAPKDEIDDPSPRSPVEGVGVVPQEPWFKVPGSHPFVQHSLAELIPLDVHESPSEAASLESRAPNS